MPRVPKIAKSTVEDSPSPAPRKKVATKTVTFDIPHSLATCFAAVAKEEGYGLSEFAEKLLRQGCERFALYKHMMIYYGETQVEDASAA